MGSRAATCTYESRQKAGRRICQDLVESYLKTIKNHCILMVFHGNHQKPLYFDTFSTGAPAMTAGDGDYLGFLNSSEISVAFRSKSIRNHWLQRWLRQCENPWCETGDRRCLPSGVSVHSFPRTSSLPATVQPPAAIWRGGMRHFRDFVLEVKA